MPDAPRRRFPSPWTVREVAEAFCVVDGTGFAVSYIYFADAAQGTNATRMTKDEARRIANGIAKLPGLLGAGQEKPTDD